MYNDGTDFVIGASSGEIQFTKPLKTYNASLAFRGDGGTTGAIGAIDFYPNATIGAWARGLTYRKQSNSQILGGFGGFGTNESLTYMPFGIGSSFFTSPTLAVYADYALIAQGNSLRIEDATEADYLDISHDGIDLNFEFVNTTDVNFNNASGYKIDGNDIATSDGTTGGTASAGSGNQYVELVIGATTYKVLHDGTI